MLPAFSALQGLLPASLPPPYHPLPRTADRSNPQPDCPSAAPPPPPPPPRPRLGHVNLPYFKGMTEPLSRIFNKAGITTSIRSRGSLRESFVRPKDKLEIPESTGVVYYLPCSGSDGTPCPDNGCYVGETERTVASRISEHFSTARISGTSTLKSAVMTHAREKDHHFRRDDFSVLSSGDQNWHDRGIKEAIYIRALKPSINRDQGRHLLPPNYDSLLQQHIKRPPPPLVHDNSVSPLLSTVPRRQGRPPRQSQTQVHSQARLIPSAPPATPSQPTQSATPAAAPAASLSSQTAVKATATS